MAAPGGRGGACTCRHCQLLQEMKRIPAKCIPHRVRMELSQVLDPVMDLPDRDYRGFADKSGIMPYIWKWLDSQKVMGETSSICKVLDYLIQERRSSYTVFSVYQTLVDMESEGQNVILQGMPDIRRMYHSGTRPGQEHAEAPSVSFQPPLSLDDNRLSPPPPYNSHHAADQGDSYPHNNLDAAGQPQEYPSEPGRRQFPQDGRGMPGAGSGQRGDGGRGSACEDSFHPSKASAMGSASGARVQRQSASYQQAVGDSRSLEQGPARLLGRNQGEPTEVSYSFSSSSSSQPRCGNGNELSPSPPSYTESQLQHGMGVPLSARQHPALNSNLVPPDTSSPTDMMELKLPLPEPVVEVEERLSTEGMNNLSSPERWTGLMSGEEDSRQTQATHPWRPAAHRQGQSTEACHQGHSATNSLQGGGTLYSQHGWSTADRQGVQGLNIAPDPRQLADSLTQLDLSTNQSYSASYPSPRHPSYKSQYPHAHRYSDGSYDSHSGASSFSAACNNSIGCSFSPPSLDSSRSHSLSAVHREPGETSAAVRGSFQPNTDGTSCRGNGSSVSCGVNPQNHAVHQTEVKRPIETTSQDIGRMCQSGPRPMPQRAKTPPQQPQGPALMLSGNGGMFPSMLQRANIPPQQPQGPASVLSGNGGMFPSMPQRANTPPQQPQGPASVLSGNGGMFPSMPQRANTPPKCRQGPASMPPEIQARTNMTDVHLPTRFIFILAADMEETHHLNEQIWKLSSQLTRLKMPHVALSSSCDQPIVHLPTSTNSYQYFLNGDRHTQTRFVETCFKEAAIVLMMVSPGYLRYADEFTAGARVAASEQQRLIRGFHEQLKSEFFDLNTTQLRVWPVLHLKATRVHLPSFLSEGTYYFYPRERGSEDLFVLLKQLVFKKENQTMRS